MLKQIQALILKDIRIELRQRYALNSVLLYVFTTIFLTYLSLQGIIQLPGKYMAALYWIILTFTAVNTISKSFIQENEVRRNYYFSLMKANTALLSKMIYNFLLLLIISFLSFGVFSVFLDFTPVNRELFLGALFLGSLGYSSILTMVSAMAAKTNANFAIVAILGFPLLLPLLLILVKITDISLMINGQEEALRYLLILLLLNIVVWVLSLLLFPYVWRD